MAKPDVKSMPEEGPEALLDRFLDGDDAAFSTLVERYEEKLFAFITRMIGDSHLAEDVFQQVFVKVAKNAAAYDGRASFSTWLFRIARNSALDELRRRSRRQEELRPGERDMESVADRKMETPLERMTREELGHAINRALWQIPEEQRETFLLKEEGELDFGEIGLILGCGRETAKSRFRLAVGKLRTLLEAESRGLGGTDNG